MEGEVAKSKEVIDYIVKKIASAKAVFILDENGHWEFYGDIPKLYNMPMNMKEPIVQHTPDTPLAWWNPSDPPESVFYTEEEELFEEDYEDYD